MVAIIQQILKLAAQIIQGAVNLGVRVLFAPVELGSQLLSGCSTVGQIDPSWLLIVLFLGIAYI